ncbi:MAG: cytochrome c biogenesis protein CcdA [Desulfovibrionaceae bacterium]
MNSRRRSFVFIYVLFLLLFPLLVSANPTTIPSYIDFSTKNYFFWEGKYVSAIVLWLEPQSGFYLYSHKEIQGKPTVVSVVSGKTEVKDVEIFYPEGEMIRDKLDPTKRVSVYEKKTPIVILLPRSLVGRTIFIRTEGLVCSDTICLPLRALAQIFVEEPSKLTNIKDEKWFDAILPAFSTVFTNDPTRKAAFDTRPPVREKSEPRTKIIEKAPIEISEDDSLKAIEMQILSGEEDTKPTNDTKKSIFDIKKQRDSQNTDIKNPLLGIQSTVRSFLEKNKGILTRKGTTSLEKKDSFVPEKKKDSFWKNTTTSVSGTTSSKKEESIQKPMSQSELLQKQQIEILMQKKIAEKRQGKRKTQQEIARDKELVYQIALEKERWKEKQAQQGSSTQNVDDNTWKDKIKKIFTSDVDVTNSEGSTKDSVDKKSEIALIQANNKENIVKNTGLWEFTPHYVQEMFEVETLTKGLLFAFLAGFILNFMPCVFPIITLKFSSLLGIISKRDSDIYDEHEREKSIHIFRVYNIFFSLGVITFFALLGFLMYSTGSIWGRIFQIPEAMLIIASIVFLLALSIFGVFDIPIFTVRIGSAGTATYQAFMTGMLTTLLATPCSAPLLGGVLSWLVQQPPSHVMIVLMTMSFGMIIPYIFFILFPTLITKLPRPGKWNTILEAMVAFFLIGTTIYLLSLLPKLWLFPSIVILFILAIGAWVWGKATGYEYTNARNLFIRIVIILILSGAISWVLQPAPVSSWETFTKKTFNLLLSKETLLVNFTADWCPNCKVLEQTVLTPENVAKWKKEYGVRFIVVDLTRENKDGEELLASLKSNSIPLLAIFPKYSGANSPLILRDIYTAKRIESALHQATQKK